MADIKRVKKGCAKAVLIYLGLGVYGFICAIMGWFFNDFFTGHSDHNHHHNNAEIVDSISADSVHTVSGDSAEFIPTN